HEMDRNDDSLAATDSALKLLEHLRRDYPNASDQHRKLAGYTKVDRHVIPDSDRPPKDPVAAHRTLIKLQQLWEDFARENPTVEGFQDDLAYFSCLLAVVEFYRGYYGEPGAFTRSLGFCRKAIALWDHLSHNHPEIASYRENLADSSGFLANILGRKGLMDEA